MKQLIAVSQKNEQNRKSRSILQFAGKFQILTSFTSRPVPVNTTKTDVVPCQLINDTCKTK